MVTNAETKHEPTREERAEATLREVIAGDQRGAIRRILLYLIAFVLVVSPVPHLAIVPLGLLALTDQLA